MNDVLKQAFVYSTGWVTMSTTAGTTVSKTISFSAGADFACNFITGHVRQANVLFANWAGTIQVQQSSSGRNLFNEAISFDAIAGNARQPYPFDPPKLFRGKTTIQVQLTNNFTTATDVQVVFHGNKLFPNEAALRASEL